MLILLKKWLKHDKNFFCLKWHDKSLAKGWSPLQQLTGDFCFTKFPYCLKQIASRIKWSVFWKYDSITLLLNDLQKWEDLMKTVQISNQKAKVIAVYWKTSNFLNLCWFLKELWWVLLHTLSRLIQKESGCKIFIYFVTLSTELSKVLVKVHFKWLTHSLTHWWYSSRIFGMPSCLNS